MLGGWGVHKNRAKQSAKGGGDRFSWQVVRKGSGQQAKQQQHVFSSRARVFRETTGPEKINKYWVVQKVLNTIFEIIFPFNNFKIPFLYSCSIGLS